MKKIFLSAALVLVSLASFSQGEYDAINYTNNEIIGSSRYVSMGGAFTSLGGDVSSISHNPAGLAFYRHNELSITPTLRFLSNSDGEATTHMDVSSGAFVSTTNFNYGTISNFNFAISYNKVADFTSTLNTSKNNRPISLLDRIADTNSGELTGRGDLNDMGKMAFDTYLLNVADNDDGSKSVYPIYDKDENVNGNMYMEERGGINEWNIAFASNWGHKFYMGATMGIYYMDYELNSIYTERSIPVSNADPINLILDNYLNTTGAGVDLKIGFIVRPIPTLRLGFAYHTPTYYSLTDDYSGAMSSSGTGNGSFDASGPFGEQDYKYQTPSKYMMGISYQIGYSGLISLDIDVVDYSKTKLRDDNGYSSTYSDVNQVISSDGATAYNFRLGGEYKLTPKLSLRAGVGYYGSAYKDVVESRSLEIQTAGTIPQYKINQGVTYLSYGLGYSMGNCYLDLGLQEKISKDNQYDFYDNFTDSENYKRYTSNSSVKTNVYLTFGYRY